MKKQGCIWWVLIGWWAAPILLLLKALQMLAEKAQEKANSTQPARTTTPPPPRAEPVRAASTQPKSTRTHKVAGTSYRQEAIRALGVLNEDYSKTEKQLRAQRLTEKWIYEYKFSPQQVELIPEPENPHDPNAIKVVVGGSHIGYIKSGSCAQIRNLLNSGRIEHIVCTIGGGRSKMLTADEDAVGGYDLISDNSPFYARLSITAKPQK